MDKLLSERTQEWMQLERKTFEQRKEADLFYEKNLMQLIEQAFIENNTGILKEKAEYMVISVETSFEPIALNLALTQPDNVLFLYTEKSKDTLDKVVRYSKLEAIRYEKRLIHETQPYEIYREIKTAFQKWKRPDKMFIDITGGTKAMSATSALAGSIINIQLLYIGTDNYLTDFRKPMPGSEKLILIDNPLVVFGDIEISEAMEFFDKCSFAHAAEKLEKLRITIPEPAIRQQLDFVYYLAKAYEEWDNLSFLQAYKYMERLLFEIRRDQKLHSEFLLVDQAELIGKQKLLLNDLGCIPDLVKENKQVQILKTKKRIVPLMFSLRQNAVTRAMQEKYDMAALLLYRLLEMIGQRRLIHYNLYASRMDYGRTEFDYARTPELAGQSAAERETWRFCMIETVDFNSMVRYTEWIKPINSKKHLFGNSRLKLAKAK